MDREEARYLAEDLVRRLLLPEEQAYLDFAQLYGGRFYRYFLSHGIPSVDARDLAADCVTDIPLRAHKYKVQKDGSFHAWVMALMRNAAADWWRRNGNKRSDPLPEDLPGQAGVRRSEDRSMIAAVHEALEQLSVEDHIVVELRYLGEERTFAEIAEFLGRLYPDRGVVTAGSVRVRHHRALKRLEQHLSRDTRIRLRRGTGSYKE